MKTVLIAALFIVGCSGSKKEDINKQIVGGHEAGNCEFPHMAYLLMNMPDGGYTACGGSLIDPFHILTAAHCVNNIIGVTAYLGHADNREAPQLIKGDRWTSTKDYRKSNHSVYNDVGMIRLEKSAKLGRCVKTISLPGKNQVFTGTCIAAGWGKMRTSAQNGPAHLRKTPIKVISTRECQKHYHGISPDQHICVGDMSHMGRNICTGDSGSPLMCRSGNKYIVAGVASYVFDCESGFGVYANVAGLLDWVKRIQTTL